MVKEYFKLVQVIAAMTCVECGIAMNQVDYESICQGYRQAFPENNEMLDELEPLDEYRDWA